MAVQQAVQQAAKAGQQVGQQAAKAGQQAAKAGQAGHQDHRGRSAAVHRALEGAAGRSSEGLEGRAADHHQDHQGQVDRQGLRDLQRTGTVVAVVVRLELSATDMALLLVATKLGRTKNPLARD